MKGITPFPAKVRVPAAAGRNVRPGSPYKSHGMSWLLRLQGAFGFQRL